MNKAKSFFSAILLSHVVLNNASPVLANPYYREPINREYYDNSYSSSYEEDTSWSELAALGVIGGLFLMSIFGGGDGGYDSPSSDSSQNRYYNTSTPSYNPPASSVKLNVKSLKSAMMLIQFYLMIITLKLCQLL